MNFLETVEKLYSFVERDNGGWNQMTCTISVAISEGFDHMAIEAWDGCGASCDQFYRLYSHFNKKYGKRFHILERRQSEDFVTTIPHADCSNCNAVLWKPNDCSYFCDSCGRDIPHE